jgi:4-diphosphocytidyl-2-C-methyl-D-erythritol kinase
VSAPLVLSAPAKLNLYLHITGRREDGYHLLDSLVAFATLADKVKLAADGPFGLSLAGAFAGSLDAVEDNLTLKAARALADWAVGGHTARIDLTKNIPVAAGLGGGSADGAAVLVGLSRLWRLDQPPLTDIAAGLGADIPVCLAAQPSFMAGVGEVLGPAVMLPGAGLLLVNPGVMLETRAVFAAYDLALDAGGAEPERPRPTLDPAPTDAEALARALAGTANDLTDAARSLAPEIGVVLDAVASTEGCRMARMAGSGPTCFGLFDDRETAASACQTLSDQASHWWCWAGGFTAGREGLTD